MVQQLERLFVYPNDLFKFYTHITSGSGVRKRYNTIKNEIGKAQNQYITVDEIAYYLGIDKQEVLKRLN